MNKFPWKAIITLAVVVPSIFLDGWVLMKLWQWLVTPWFPILPLLSLQAATGLAFFCQYMIGLDTVMPAPPYNDWEGSLFMLVFRPLLALGMGWMLANIPY